MLTASCTVGKTPQQWFELTWAGLAGSDTLKFRGEAALMVEGENAQPEAFAYTGELKNHTSLTLKAKLASQEKVLKAADRTLRTQQFKPLEMKLTGTTWSVKGGAETVKNLPGLAQSIARLHPLAELEKLHVMKKQVTLEKGAARGTRVLRIQTDPADESSYLRDLLTGEMADLRQEWELGLKQLPLIERASYQAKGVEVWKKSQAEMNSMLDTAQVQSLYHLTIDRKSGLPIRLTSSTQIRYLDRKGTRRMESLWNDSRFTGYK
ncbi:hypothetical protein [Paenibacillus sp. CAA11]|uniref:hypothetical protein n=1 Tax=Paenibacillus sp. CAA11 TaxID=1532905 RepID=UPI00131F3E36|nr:hypothetical protein [Paenibacillus sp. CAA11]